MVASTIASGLPTRSPKLPDTQGYLDFGAWQDPEEYFPVSEVIPEAVSLLPGKQVLTKHTTPCTQCSGCAAFHGCSTGGMGWPYASCISEVALGMLSRPLPTGRGCPALCKARLTQTGPSYPPALAATFYVNTKFVNTSLPTRKSAKSDLQATPELFRRHMDVLLGPNTTHVVGAWALSCPALFCALLGHALQHYRMT